MLYVGFVAGKGNGGWEVGEAAVEEALAKGVGPGVGVAKKGDEDVAVAEFGLAAGAAADGVGVVVVFVFDFPGIGRSGEVLEVTLGAAIGVVLDGGGDGMVNGWEWVAAVAVFHGGVGEGKGGCFGGEGPDFGVGFVPVVVAFDVGVGIGGGGFDRINRIGIRVALSIEH